MSASKPPRYRLLALGDSYTAGEGVPASQRWPEQLRSLLVPALGPATAIDIDYVARTGWTTDELASAIRELRPSGPFDLVSLLVGVNNQYRGRPLAEYREQFRALLATSLALADGDARRVVVLSIPDWGATPFAEGRDREHIARDIDAFNAANRDETGNAGACYVDVTRISRRATAEAEMIAADGLHPSARMYRLWAEAALPQSLAALGQ